jgi:hypothetical protein
MPNFVSLGKEANIAVHPFAGLVPKFVELIFA